MTETSPSDGFVADPPRVIGFLGIGNYSEATYEWHDKQAKGCYAPLVIATLVGARRVQLLATQAARQAHEDALREAAKAASLEVEIKPIPDGASAADLRQIFERLLELIREVEARDVVLDITLGYRAIPFFAGAVVDYLDALNHPGRIRIVYGAFDAVHRDHQPKPVWELGEFSEVLQWARAIEQFLSTGLGRPLADLAEANARAYCRDRAQQGARRELQGAMRLPTLLRSFSEAVDAIRVSDLLLGRPESARALDRVALVTALREELRQQRGSTLGMLPLLSPLLDQLDAMLEKLELAQSHLGGEAGQRALQALASLYLRWGRLAEAATILREGWICLHGGDSANAPGQPGWSEQARRLAEHTWLGTRARTPTVDDISRIRNDINHAGFRANPLAGAALKSQLARQLDVFGRPSPRREPGQQRQARTWFVSRHPGALEWLDRQGIKVDEVTRHLDVDSIQRGDTVIGTLPIHLAAAVCARGAVFRYLAIDVPPEARGKELDADAMGRLGARLETYEVRQTGTPSARAAQAQIDN